MLPFIPRTISQSSFSPYLFIGINIASSVNKLEIAMIQVDSPSPGTPITLIKSMSFDLPREICEAYRKIRHRLQNSEKSSRSTSQSEAQIDVNDNLVLCEDREVLLLRSLIVSVQEEAVRELLHEAQLSIAEITAVTLANTGFVFCPKGIRETPCYFNVNDGEELAKKLRANVVHSFFFENLNQVFDCHPFSLAYWLLLSDKTTGQLFIDFGKSLRWFYLPPTGNDSPLQVEIKYRDVIGCGSLLDAITQEITRGKQDFDEGGNLSIQGKVSRNLLSLWDSKYHFFQSHYSPFLLNESFYTEAQREALNNSSSLDVLCAASHWIVQNLENSLVENLDYFSSSCPIITTGASLQNTLLKRLIEEKFAKFKLRRLASYGFIEDSFDAIATAILGLLVNPCCPPTSSQTQTFPPRKMIPGGVLSTTRDSFHSFHSYMKKKKA